ncbi:hypothetical protein [uncultured Arthrobacter sp.]|uniref:hypothetical protein n=1 Tax=uncultured Arthrobacter sp. TaxID=114050 RepID=UPI00260464FA|nr:hypothetical protein [uncultured Arthrobacter sp.]
MPGYAYTDKQIQGWPTAAAAAALWERCHYLETQADYWKRRCESAEARMLAHDCMEES